MMKKGFIGFGVFVVTTFFLTTNALAQQTKDTSMAAITGFVKASGRKYTTHENGTLIVDTPKDKLYVFTKGGFLLMSFSRVLPKAYLPRTDAVLFNLMRLNDTLNFSKVGIDEDGDLFLRVEARSDLVDKYEFERIVKQLIDDYDKVKAAVFSPAPAPK